jgi:hypothetical protein
MDFDAVGTARMIWHVTALAGLGIFGLIWTTYASHCFLTVLTESSIGDAEVRWSDESILDWWWKPLYCLGMLIFWTSVTGIFVSALILVSPWIFAAAFGLIIWYAFPVGLLCVMDARSSVAVVHLPLLVRLASHLPTVLLVGLITLLPASVAGGLFVGLLLHSIFWALPAALVLPPVLFFYSRCWGRLAWMLLNIKPRARTSSTERAPPGAAHARIHDPWAMPPEEPIPEIDVALDEPEPPAPDLDEDNEWAEKPAPYLVTPTMLRSASAAAEQGDPAGGQFEHAPYYAEYRKRDELRRARAEGLKPGERKRRRRASFRNAFGKDLLPFLIQRRTIRAGLGLAAATLIFLVLLRIAILTAPPPGG